MDLSSKVSGIPPTAAPMVAFQHHERELRELPINTCDISSLLQADEAERAKDHFRLYQAAADMLQKWYETLYNATQRVERRLLDVPPQTGWHRWGPRLFETDFTVGTFWQSDSWIGRPTPVEGDVVASANGTTIRLPPQAWL